MIEQIELLADMLELEGTEAFRVLAYRRAAQRIGESRRLDRAARARRQGEGAPGDREDDRGEDRPDRREGRDRGADEAARTDPARRGRLHAAARARAEDGAADLAGARRDHARRPAGGGRAAAAAHADRPRPEGRGERPQGAEGAREAEDAVAAVARPGTACGARRGRDAARPPGRRAGVGGGERAPPPRDVPRSRHHRHCHRREGADRRIHRPRLGRRKSQPRAARRRR